MNNANVQSPERVFTLEVSALLPAADGVPSEPTLLTAEQYQMIAPVVAGPFNIYFPNVKLNFSADKVGLPLTLHVKRGMPVVSARRLPARLTGSRDSDVEVTIPARRFGQVIETLPHLLVEFLTEDDQLAHVTIAPQRQLVTCGSKTCECIGPLYVSVCRCISWSVQTAPRKCHCSAAML